MISKKIFLNLSVFLFFILVTLIFFSPLLNNFSSRIISDYDGLHNTWCLNAIIQNVLSDGSEVLLSPKKLMEGNIFYPYRYSIAFNDPFITDALIALPFVKATGEPLVAFNINLVVSQILLLFFGYLFLAEFCSSQLVALLFSLIFSFSGIRLHYFYVGHLNMFSLSWVPLAGFSLLRLAKTKKPIFLYLFFFSFIAQVLNSFLAGYFIIFLSAGLIAWNKNLREVIMANLVHLLIGGMITTGAVFPFVKLYLEISRLYNYSRSVRDGINFSLSPEELFTAKFFSPALLTLFLVALVYFIFNKRKRREEIFSLVLSIFFLLMALGPAFHFFQKTVKVLCPVFGSCPIPLPYTVFYYLLPGFKGFRTPSRWVFPFGFLMAAFTAAVISNFLKKRTRGVKALVFFTIAGLFLFSFQTPKDYFSFPSIKNYPAVYFWLKNQPGRVILEVPIYYWGDFINGKREPAQMVYSLLHQKRTVNGYGSFSPKEWEDWIVFLRKDFPSRESILMLQESGVDYLVVHRDEFKDLWPADFQKRLDFLKTEKDLKLIYEDDQDLVYELY